MIELLRRIAAQDPDRLAIITPDERWTYAALARTAEQYAAGLRAEGIDRFAVVTNEIPHLVALMAAASLAGVESCNYAPDITEDALLQQAATLGHTTTLTTRDELVAALGGSPAGVRALAGLPTDGPAIAEPPASRPLMVLTTGTTGAPRGVRHDWARQLSRSGQIRDGAGQKWLLAYGPQQFAGLQVLIHVFSSGATLVAPPVRRPQAVMDLIVDEHVDHISATPTFWRFLLAEMRAGERPVPALRQITLGGEAAPEALLEELAERFPDARISHVYAGSEFGSTSSVRDGHGGLPVSLLEREEGGLQLKIVDGELWVRSSASMLGYHGEEDRAASDWWPTGDAVEVVEDRIVFRGRTSEVINVGGVKVHPLPVEERVGAVPGVRVARVHGRPNALVGAVVAVDVVPDGTVDEDTLKKAVRDACADLPRPWQPRSVQLVDEVLMKENKLVRKGER